jgi:hypothetical protein
MIVSALLASASAMSAESANGPRPISLGSRRELFVDRFVVDQMKGAYLHLHEPRDEGAVLKFDEAWEGPQSGYVTIIKDQDQYLAFYRGVSELTHDGSEHERTCIAESKNGITWNKPEVGLFEFKGTRTNNIILADAAPATHNFCPMIDSRPGVATGQHFKALGGTPDKLFAFVSQDGRAWKKLRDEAVITKADVPIPHIHLFDSQNVPFWSEAEQKYVCYFRIWDGLRRVARTTSQDFVHWTPAELMDQVHDDGKETRPAPKEHIYTNQTSAYFRAPHIYVAIAARFFEGRQVLTEAQARAIHVDPDYFKDTSDAILMTSRGGHTYDRTFLEGYLRPGIGANNWVSRTNYPALNIVQTGPTEMSFYVNQDFAQPTAHLRRYSLRLDGIASVRAGAESGEFVTKPIRFTGNELEINFSTSAGGGLQLELQDEAGSPLPGFALKNCQEQIGNEIDRRVTWKNGASLSSLAGKTVRLRCVIKDGDLFSFRFVP